jgi:hypothetical protein
VKKIMLLASLVICIIVGGTMASRAAFSSTQEQPRLQAAAVKVVGDGGVGVQTVPMVASRDGKARVLDSIGVWSLQRMGYSDLVFPCTARAEAITTDNVLPCDAAQGPDKWYVLHVDMEIEFSEDCQDGMVEVSPMTNGALAEGLVFLTSRPEGSLEIQWGKCGADMQSATSSTVSASFSTYLRDADLTDVGVKPGPNSLTFAMSQRGDAKVDRLQIHRSSAIEVVLGERDSSVMDFPALPAEEADKAKTIALNDPLVQQVLSAGEHTIIAIAPWELPPGAGDARIDVLFKVPHQIQLDWPWPPTPIRQGPTQGNFWVRGISIAIDLQREVVTGISPSLQFWSQPVE